MSARRLGVIGAGGITEFHLPAAREAGFEVTALAARPGSTSPAALAARHEVGEIFGSADDLLAARDRWDALLVTVSVPALLATLTAALETGVPVLIEKPAALRSADLAPLLDSDVPVQVAYNRRFYAGVRSLYDEVRRGDPVLATLTLPEGIRGWGGPGTDTGPLLKHFSNSVHAFDLLLHLFGPLDLVASRHVRDSDGTISGVAATLGSARGDAIHVLLDWSTPTNMALSVDRPGRRLDLRPFEHLTVYEGMEVVEPTPERPIRTYQPKVLSEVPLMGDDLEFKPGFVGQFRAFAALCDGDDPHPAARLADAHAALHLAETIVGDVWRPEEAPIPEEP